MVAVISGDLADKSIEICGFAPLSRCETAFGHPQSIGSVQDLVRRMVHRQHRASFAECYNAERQAVIDEADK